MFASNIYSKEQMYQASMAAETPSMQNIIYGRHKSQYIAESYRNTCCIVKCKESQQYCIVVQISQWHRIVTSGNFPLLDIYNNS